MYKIDKGIPMKHSIHGGGIKSKYPFKDMVVGDSFLIPCEDDRKKRQHIASAVLTAAKIVPKMKFTTAYKKEENGFTNGIRVWRIE